jgi:Cof subfamily protein (haloacid dehalogenase superfamily)
MKFRALCTDIDGTLLDSRRELSKKTIDAFQRIPKSIPVILASSRMPAAMIHLQHQLGIADHPLVCYNGGYAVHYNRDPQKVFATVSIPFSVCASILDLTKGTAIHTSLYHEDLWYAPAIDQWTEREQRITKVNAIIADGPSVIEKWSRENNGAHKVMCMGPEPEIHSLESKINSSFADQIHIYRSRPTYLELAPKSVSKATALEFLLQQEFGIRLKEVIAFGDNFNDMEMLQSAGLGVAVGNAKAEVKAVAKEIAGNSIEDGVAIAMEKYFF